MVGLALLGVAFAQGERLLEPMEPVNPSSTVRSEWYAGTEKLRFVSWFTQNTYAVLNEPVTFQFTYFGNSAVKAIRFTTSAGGSGLRVNFDAKNIVLGVSGSSHLGTLTSVRFTVNASDFGVNAGAKSYRVALLDAAGREGEPIELTLNFRSRTDYRTDPTLLRVQETLTDVVPIGYFQAQQGGSVFVPSVQNFNSYSRLWFEIRLPPNFDLYWNTISFTTAVRTGIVTLSDDAGTRYEVAWDDRALTPLPDSNGFRFALIMTPKLSANAKRLILVQAPVKAENVPSGLRLEDTVEPFRSGLTLNLPLQR
jgi:hypothetical protein